MDTLRQRTDLNRRLAETVDTLFDQVSREFGNYFQQPARLIETVRQKAYPKMNVYVLGDTLVLEASVPGLEKEAIDISIENNTLTISSNDLINDVNPEVCIIKEIPRSRFSRSIRFQDGLLPNDVSQIEAKLIHGILRLEIPYKKENPQSKTVTIR